MPAILPIATPTLSPMTTGPVLPDHVAPSPSVDVAQKFGTAFTSFGSTAIHPTDSMHLDVRYASSARAAQADHLFADTIGGVHLTNSSEHVDQQPVDLTISGLVDALKGSHLVGLQDVQAHGMNGAPGMIQVFADAKYSNDLQQLLKPSIDGWHVVVTPRNAMTQH